MIRENSFFIFLILFCFFIFTGDLQKDDLKKNDILNSSEFGYKVKYGGFHFGPKPAPEFYIFSLKCERKKAFRIYGYIFLDETKKEKKERISLKNYLTFWNTLEQNKVWELRTIDIENPFWIINGEYKKELEPYKEEGPPVDTDCFSFFINVENRSHSYNLCGIDYLKDHRYKTIFDKMNTFFSDLINTEKNKSFSKEQ